MSRVDLRLEGGRYKGMNNPALTIKGGYSMNGLASLLTVAFVVLKLTGVIAWSWIWVLSPAWIGLVVFLIITFIIAIGN
jgi:hypothetical protein